jgi:hypothetical protein
MTWHVGVEGAAVLLFMLTTAAKILTTSHPTDLTAEEVAMDEVE